MNKITRGNGRRFVKLNINICKRINLGAREEAETTNIMSVLFNLD